MQADAKRRKLENGEEVTTPVYATQFSKEEIENEERRPKKKVALLMGYSGTGYSGMQLYVERLVQSYYRYIRIANMLAPGMISIRPSRAIFSQLLSPPVPFPKPTRKTPRSHHLFDAPEPTRECMRRAMWFH